MFDKDSIIFVPMTLEMLLELIKEQPPEPPDHPSDDVPGTVSTQEEARLMELMFGVDPCIGLRRHAYQLFDRFSVPAPNRRGLWLKIAQRVKERLQLPSIYHLSEVDYLAACSIVSSHMEDNEV